MTRISELRKAKGWTQQILADNIGVSRSTVAMWESGRNEPDNQMLSQLAELFSCSVDYLLERTEDPHDYENDDLSDVRSDVVRYFNGDARKIRKFLAAEERDSRQTSDEAWKQPRKKTGTPRRAIVLPNEPEKPVTRRLGKTKGKEAMFAQMKTTVPNRDDEFQVLRVALDTNPELRDLVMIQVDASKSEIKQMAAFLKAIRADK